MNDAESSANDDERPDARASGEAIMVRRIAPADGDLLREVRLAAIADSPGAYATTLAEAESRELFQWERVAEASAQGSDQATFFAESEASGEAEVAGMVNAFRTVNGVVTMTSLWSAPGFRDAGVAEALVTAVQDWGIASGGVQLRLWVVQRNEHARGFYERLGFQATGVDMPYEPDPRIMQCEMHRSLA